MSASSSVRGIGLPVDIKGMATGRPVEIILWKVSRRDQPQVMPQIANLSAPEISAAAGLHRDDE